MCPLMIPWALNTTQRALAGSRKSREMSNKRGQSVSGQWRGGPLCHYTGRCQTRGSPLVTSTIAWPGQAELRSPSLRPPLQLSLNFTTINRAGPGPVSSQWEWQLGLDYYATDKFRSDYFLRMGLTLSASTRDKIKPGSRELDSHSRFLVSNMASIMTHLDLGPKVITNIYKLNSINCANQFIKSRWSWSEFYKIFLIRIESTFDLEFHWCVTKTQFTAIQYHNTPSWAAKKHCPNPNSFIIS